MWAVVGQSCGTASVVTTVVFGLKRGYVNGVRVTAKVLTLPRLDLITRRWNRMAHS